MPVSKMYRNKVNHTTKMTFTLHWTMSGPLGSVNLFLILFESNPSIWNYSFIWLLKTVETKFLCGGQPNKTPANAFRYDNTGFKFWQHTLGTIDSRTISLTAKIDYPNNHLSKRIPCPSSITDNRVSPVRVNFLFEWHNNAITANVDPLIIR